MNNLSQKQCSQLRAYHESNNIIIKSLTSDIVEYNDENSDSSSDTIYGVIKTPSNNYFKEIFNYFTNKWNVLYFYYLR
jgi:hypothetical protein